MSYPINYPTPQFADVQMFQKGGSVSDWVKPQGASFVYFSLIGGGGGGGGAEVGIGNGCGGASGAVTNFLCPAFLIPDVLRVSVGAGGAGGSAAPSAGVTGGTSTIVYQAKDGTGYTLLSANGGTRGTASSGTTVAGGAAMTPNYFTAMGFFQSVAGQDGNRTANISASTTTFLSGGTCNSNVVTPNYGYPPSNNSTASSGGTVEGYFQMQPIIVGRGGNSANTLVANGYTGGGGNGGVGCGGGGGNQVGSTTPGGSGGSGLVTIISW